MPTIRQLNQRRPGCDHELVEDCCALYEGGERFKKRLRKFLPQRNSEHYEVYATRCNESHYQNYLGPIVDYFAAMLFTSRAQPVAKRIGTEEPVVEPGDYYNAFRKNCDRTGTDIDTFYKDRFTSAMVEGRAWFRVREPQSTAVVVDRADFEKRKLGDCWLEPLCFEEVVDWETDDVGNLQWVITHKKTARREGPGGSRDTITEVWEYVSTEDVETFAVRYHKDNPPAPDFEVPSLGVTPHRFGRVPVFCIDLPIGMWVAQRIASPQLAHFRLSNAQTWSLSRTCYAMPVYKVTDPEAFNQRMGAGIGITILPEESVDWIAPPGEHFASLREEIQTHKDEIFRIAHQMALGVENNAHTVGRTAESKIADAQATRVMLVAFAKEVKEEMARVYDAISVSRGDEYEWSINGLDEFVTADLQGFLTALQLVNDKIGGIPSDTANIKIKTKMVEGLLPESDQETLAKIRAEIEDGVRNAVDEDEAELNRTVRLHQELARIDAATAESSGAGAAGGKKPPKAARGGSARSSSSSKKA